VSAFACLCLCLSVFSVACSLAGEAKGSLPVSPCTIGPPGFRVTADDARQLEPLLSESTISGARMLSAQIPHYTGNANSTTLGRPANPAKQILPVPPQRAHTKAALQHALRRACCSAARTIGGQGQAPAGGVDHVSNFEVARGFDRGPAGIALHWI
jgi:hypothetical protein